ncbi:Modifier of rudimentary (Mod(r)) protein [Rhynchospora pubera]|uniref:Modifier of rudimentary (Mod(R)) protein n=1 Tax=Rhynchospora pubera TaxID=906938 RepID=A0AAV8DBL2_9POAL|nr:Modifier of rudimentary (Mod(r)) protein [Rhynchospora pubera]
MSWRIPFFAGSDQVQTPSSTHGVPTQSWYPPSVIPPSTQSSAYSTSSSSELMSLSADAKSAGIVSQLKYKSVDELKKLLADKAAYKAFFNSLDEVRIQNHTYGDLRKEMLQLAESNLEKEPSLVELKNQCNVIRTSELASAQEKLAELSRQRDGIVHSYSRSGLLDKLNEAAYKADEESEMLQTKLQKEEVDIRTFVQSYKNLRTTHHKLTLLYLAAKTSVF